MAAIPERYGADFSTHWETRCTTGSTSGDRSAWRTGAGHRMRAHLLPPSAPPAAHLSFPSRKHCRAFRRPLRHEQSTINPMWAPASGDQRRTPPRSVPLEPCATAFFSQWGREIAAVPFQELRHQVLMIFAAGILILPNSAKAPSLIDPDNFYVRADVRFAPRGIDGSVRSLRCISALTKSPRPFDSPQLRWPIFSTTARKNSCPQRSQAA